MGESRDLKPRFPDDEQRTRPDAPRLLQELSDYLRDGRALHERLGQLLGELEPAASDIQTLKSEVAELKRDVADLKRAAG